MLKRSKEIVFSASLVCAATIASGAWYADRDNSSVPLSGNHPQFDAFVTFAASQGISQGVQVCPNVFLATGHGVDETLNAGLEAVQNWIKIIQYPMSDIRFFDLEPGNFDLTTEYLERFGRPRSQRDYAFFSVDAGLAPHPETFIRPVIAVDGSEIVAFSETGDLDIHSFRPATRFDLDSDGIPNFDQSIALSGLDTLMPIYDAPRFTAQRCELTPDQFGDVLSHSCPTEAGVSGSAVVIEAEGQFF